MKVIENKRVSAIIPAYNAEKTIAACVQALQNQSKNYELEILVVDDGSTDSTAKIVQSFPDVRYIHQKNAGPAAARNRGAQEATGEFLFFTDSDCIAQPDCIWKLLNHFRNNNDKIGVASGSYGIANPENLLAKGIHKEILYRHHHLVPAYPRVFGSYNFCIRKKVFFLVGGFNSQYPHASGEDNDLSYKIIKAGFKIYFERTALVDHYHPTQVKKYLNEQYRHGFWRAKMYRDHPTMMKGDDYTFWKDVVEVWLVLFLLLSVVLAFFHLRFLLLGWNLFWLLMGLQLWFAWTMSHSLQQTFYFGPIIFLRAFARTFGFLRGILRFLRGS